MRLLWSVRAGEDLADLQAWLSERDPDAAERVVAGILARAGALLQFPYMGRAVPDLPSGTYREIIEDPYRIVYRLHGDRVEIVTVFDGRRLPPWQDNEPAEEDGEG